MLHKKYLQLHQRSDIVSGNQGVMRIKKQEKIMRLIDISQELFSCHVFPNDPEPVRKEEMRIEKGDACNLTSLSMCAHNGTHVDAPNHFLDEGKTIDQMGLEPYVGDCYVARFAGEVGAADAELMVQKAAAVQAGRRILIAGNATVTADAARVFAQANLLLLGNESQTVGPEDAPQEVHLILLGQEVTLLEGIVLDGVKEGKYFLSAAPLNLGGCDGAPCRAYLILW